MKVLLDTHTFLWALLEPDKLSVTSRNCLEDLDTELIVNAASAWDIATKYRIGKLSSAEVVIEQFEFALIQLQAREMPISRHHSLRAGLYSVAHRDPFDRILAAQSELEQLPLLTNDSAFDLFSIKTIW